MTDLTTILNATGLSDRPTLGIDIGGANLKYADTLGRSLSNEFPLWLRHEDLANQLANDIASISNVGQVVATMTGELADCFTNRQQGVFHIVEQLCRACTKLALPAPLFYSMQQGFVSAADARNDIDAIAAGNWHALASYVAREMDSCQQPAALLVDIGSTTTDLIPIRNGKVATDSRTDFDRLAEGSLVYLGGGRTAICGLVQTLNWRGQDIPVMREVFATMDDVRLLMNFQKPDASDCRSADGKPRDHFHAANRIARMIGLDHRSVDIDSATKLATQVHHRASTLITQAIASLVSQYDLPRPLPIMLSGHGHDLLNQQVGNCQVLSLADHWGTEISRAAPAYAVAKLYAS